MSNGLNLGSVLNIASIVGAVMSGGSSLLLQAGMNLAMQVGQQALSGALDRMGLGSMQDLLSSAFQAGFSSATGLSTAVSDSLSDLTATLADASNSRGELTQAVSDLEDAIFDLTMSLTTESTDEASEGEGSSSSASQKGGASNWLVAMARAMGEALGNQAGKMIELTQEMKESTAQEIDDDDTQAQTQQAQEFNMLMTEYQAQSQMYNMLSSSYATAIKAIGEGLAGLARKQ